ncbi:hypothetical protein AcW1_005596 [Taiwanofungus camphoratus]|nr:hypothetical protein AcW2_004362 [Antrodia cinnamomea]KAI0948304.1 hypothetical protein AcV7_009094 [Antrodia cinnamomea]KAI0957097.1 hypothetical protein AcW1_005596 [Antrodia cinnamomea]
MESRLLSTIAGLSAPQQAALKRGSILTVADLLLIAPEVLAKRCKIYLSDAQRIVEVVCNTLACQPRLLEDVLEEGDEKFTTGDPKLDEALGGGIRTGMLWEIVGESAAGKTQLALQLSLLVQVPRKLGGLSSSACILTTTSTLPTTRLMEIANNHPLLSPTLCSLSDIHTIKTPEIPILLHVLSNTFPAFLDDLAARSGSKPVKLLVIDTLTELFHSHAKTSSDFLFQRSKNLSDISRLLHIIANKYRIAVVVLNEVVDVFDRAPDADFGQPGELIYWNQARWFNRADSISGAGVKEASLGLVWANQVNARIMLTRTERMRYLDRLDHRKTKRRRLDGVSESRSINQPTRVRRLSVIFSPLAPPTSMDYIVSDEGIVVLPEVLSSPIQSSPPEIQPPGPSSLTGNTSSHNAAISPNDAGLTFDALVTGDNGPRELTELAEAEEGPQEDRDGWDAYWKEADTQENLYRHVAIDHIALVDDITS